MTSDRWRDIERICEAALAVGAEQRAAVLDEHCAGDADLRREVEALLAQAPRTDGFLEAPVFEDAVAALPVPRSDPRGAPSAAGDEAESVLLPEGTRLGPYEIVAPIGAGGMGTVYEARDTRLERTVAIKVLPPDFATDPDRRVRFTREAKTIASLNHPHICTLHDTGEAIVAGSGSPDPGSRVPDPVSVSYLVMERVAGDTLAARLEQGPLPVALACELGAQIADALAAAHRHGVIHRDLKPANIMLTPGVPGSDGVPHVKLLDFGLAKLTGHGEQAVVTTEGEDPTRTDSLTARGTILGTLPYMAPEQLEGKPADARTDLWALGTVLYEMATGQPAFAGDSAVTLMGNILTTDPPRPGEGQPTVPPALDRLVRKCLAKRPDDRWDSAHDVADELRWVRDVSVVPSVVPASRGERPSRALTYAAVALVSVVAAATATWVLTRPAPTSPEVRHVSVETAPATLLRAWPGEKAIALSPDGTTLVFAGAQGRRQQLYLRRLDQNGVAVPIHGTEGARAPFFSPNGAWIGYWARDAIWKVRIDGGAPVEVFNSKTPAAYSWSRSGMIASSATGITMTPDTGGESAVVLPDGSVDGEVGYDHPHFLPDGQTLLFSIHKGGASYGAVAALSVSSHVRTPLVDAGLDASYIPAGSGYLVYARRGRLEAAPFDPVRLAVTGEAAVVLPDVMQAENTGRVSATGVAQYAFSDTGTLAYVAGGVFPDRQNELVWLDRTGAIIEVLPLAPGPYSAPRVSPEGRRILYVRSGRTPSLWCFDTDRQAATVIPTPGAEPMFPIWFPDGQRVLYTDALKMARLSVVAIDGSSPPTEVPGQEAGGFPEFPGSWMPDGSLIYTRWRSLGAGDDSLWRLDLNQHPPARSMLVDAPAQAQVTVGARRWTTWPAVSPDGRRLAYVSDETGRDEVYVLDLPGLEDRRQISTDGGRAPVWRRDGRELFYLAAASPPRKLMTVEVPQETGAAWGRPRRICDLGPALYLGTFYVPAYDVSPDGQRFLFVRQPLNEATPPPPSRINIVFNWFEELKAKVPRTGTR